MCPCQDLLNQSFDQHCTEYVEVTPMSMRKVCYSFTPHWRIKFVLRDGGLVWVQCRSTNWISANIRLGNPKNPNVLHQLNTVGVIKQFSVFFIIQLGPGNSKKNVGGLFPNKKQFPLSHFSFFTFGREQKKKIYFSPTGNLLFFTEKNLFLFTLAGTKKKEKRLFWNRL